jgi:DNA polymerase IIIc chi subunit
MVRGAHRITTGARLEACRRENVNLWGYADGRFVPEASPRDRAPQTQPITKCAIPLSYCTDI